MKSLYSVPYLRFILLITKPRSVVMMAWASAYSRRTLVLGTYRVVDSRIIYTNIEKDVVHKLFGFPIFKHAGSLTPSDLNQIIS